jgi:hypothetical protein
MPKKKNNQEKWWQKEIDPIFSFVFLMVAMIIIFLTGALFMKEYLRLWSELNKIEQQNSFYQDQEEIKQGINWEELENFEQPPETEEIIID